MNGTERAQLGSLLRDLVEHAHSSGWIQGKIEAAHGTLTEEERAEYDAENQRLIEKREKARKAVFAYVDRITR